MKKTIVLTFFVIFLSQSVLGDLKPLYPDDPKIGTKEYVEKYCPNFSYGQNNCIDGLNVALKYGYKVTQTYKESKSIIYMLRRNNKIAMCKVNTEHAVSWCALVD